MRNTSAWISGSGPERGRAAAVGTCEKSSRQTDALTLAEPKRRGPVGCFLSGAIGLLLIASVLTAAPAEKTLTCATCHREQAASSPLTPMGIGMELPPNQTSLKAHPQLAADWKGYRYTVERKDGVSVYTVSNGAESLQLPIRYAFGVRMQTYVFVYQGRYFESMMSYYATLGGLAVTLGDERMEPKSLLEALGKEYTETTISRCFGCHSSGAVAGSKLHLETLRPGLDCEHCHTGATAHLEALAQGKTAPLPEKLGEKSSEEMSTYCGGCHRSWEEAVRLRLWGPVNVRFQPYRLALSKCFIGNDRRIGCTACHNPHRELVRDTKFYDAKCLACHAASGSARPVAATHGVSAGPLQKACPVASENCTSCHMQKVDLPGGNSKFTDHYIRVVRPGEKYPD